MTDERVITDLEEAEIALRVAAVEYAAVSFVLMYLPGTLADELRDPNDPTVNEVLKTPGVERLHKMIDALNDAAMYYTGTWERTHGQVTAGKVDLKPPER